MGEMIWIKWKIKEKTMKYDLNYKQNKTSMHREKVEINAKLKS